MRTEDDLRAALTALERHAPAAARVLPGSEPRRSGRGLRSPRTIRLLSGVATAAALAGVVTALTLPGGTHTPIPNGGVAPPAPVTKATLQARLLAALSAAGNEIVYTHGTFWSTGSGWTHTDMSPDITETWVYPWQAHAGQQVRSRSIAYSLDGLFHSDSAVSYVMPGPGSALSGPAIGAFRATGERISVNYVGKTWSDTKNSPLTIDNADNPALIAFYLKSKQWTARDTTLNGRAAIELTLKDKVVRGKSTVNSWIEYLWIDASTYLPLRETETFGPPNTVSHGMTDWQYLPATAANLAKLTPPIPAGFRQVTPPSPPKWAKPAGPLYTISPSQAPPSAVPVPSVSPAPR
jgi:hypothetical protein